MTEDMGLGRFTVRDIGVFDAANLFELLGDAETVRYLGVRRLETLEQAQELIQRYAVSATRWLAVCDGQEFLGIVGLEVRGHQATVFIAFKRTRKARGAGRAFSVPFVTYLFTHKNIWRVWSYCHVDNVAVQRVLDRMGAACEGKMRRFEIFPNISHEPQDVYMYAIVRD